MIKMILIILWAGNLNKGRYSRTLGENRNHNISGMVYALLPVQVNPNHPTFDRYPDSLHLLKSIKESLPVAVRNWQLLWKNNLMDFRNQHLTFDNSRHPWEITGTGISSGPGLLQTLLYANQILLHTRCPNIPLLVDINPFHRTLKLFFLTRDRSSTKCPLRVHIAGHGSVTGPTLGMGLV